jgi:hypothetical protein
VPLLLLQISANLRKALGGNAKDVVAATGELLISQDAS